MHFTTGVLSASVALAAGTQAQQAITTGFTTPRLHDSQGGLASCVSGYIPLTVTSPNNIMLKMPIPQNQFQVSQSFITSFTPVVGQEAMMAAMGPKHSVTGNFSMYSTLCVPKQNANSQKALQFLTHGVGADSGYWDFMNGNSYVDVAAMSGVTTFSYDRLGVGLSSKPNPIQVIQAPMEVEIAHALVQKLKAGSIGGTAHSKIVGVGHSFGSAITQGVTNEYPQDLAGAVLTGFTTNMTGNSFFTAALNLQIASVNNPERFAGLNNGFLVAQNVISNQLAFFRYPGFDPQALYKAELTKGTVTPAELMTLMAVVKPASSFKAPVLVVNGDYDVPFCFGNCRLGGGDMGRPVLTMLYPGVGQNGQTILVPNSGHGINFHLSAPQAFMQIQQFVGGKNL